MEKGTDGLKKPSYLKVTAMIYTGDVTPVIKEWKQRLRNGNSNDYNVALEECIHDLESTVDSSIRQQVPNDNYYS